MKFSNKRGVAANGVKDKGDMVLNSQEKRKKRWKEHFGEKLNRPQPGYPLDADVEGDAAVEIDTGPIRKEDIFKALKNVRKEKNWRNRWYNS